MSSYKRNYINEALLRLDFPIFIDELKTKISPKISKIISKDFPIFEANEVKHNKISLDNKNSKGKDDISFESEFQKEWKFSGMNRQKYVKLTSEYLIISYKEYESFSIFYESIKNIVDGLYNIYEDIQVKRMGLRYINTINSEDKDFFNWEGYINKSLLEQFNFKYNEYDFTRALTKLEYKHDFDRLNFQYGMFNPNYPSKIKDKVFVLDYDYYTDSFTDSKIDIFEFVERGHSVIEDMFEKSIGDKLREEMNTNG